MNKHIVVQRYNRILFNNKKEQNTDTYNNMNESQVHFFLGKVARYKSYILHDSILFHFGKGKTVGTENKSVMPRGWGRGKS